MTTAETVRRLLVDAAGEAVCDSCLAFACSMSLSEMRQLTEELLNHGYFQRGDRCLSCGRTVPAIMYSPKCAHCSNPVRPREDALDAGGDIFHAVCFRVVTSDDRIRLSRKLTLDSRRLIESARRQVTEQRRRSAQG